MHGQEAILLILIALLLLNIPAFLFGFLAMKCGLRLCSKARHSVVVRWMLPMAMGLVAFLFGVGVTIAFAHSERPWPTSPVLSGWGCLGLLCAVDFLLLLLWPWLKYRGRRSSPPHEQPAGAIETEDVILPLAPTRRAAFRLGFTAPWIGLQYMGRHPGLWRYGLIPFLLNLLITTVALVLLIGVAGHFIVVLHARFAGDWYWRLVEVLADLAVLVVAFGLSVAVWVILQGLLCGHFYAKLAEQIELRLGMKREDIREVPFSAQVFDTLVDAAFLAAVNLGLLLLHCVPGIGSIAAVAASWYLTSMTLGADYFEYPLALRGCRRSEMRDFARRHRPCTVGLGTVVAMVAMIPIVNALLLTTVVTGAVILHRNLAAKECDKQAASATTA